MRRRRREGGDGGREETDCTLGEDYTHTPSHRHTCTEGLQIRDHLNVYNVLYMYTNRKSNHTGVDIMLQIGYVHVVVTNNKIKIARG